MTEHPVDRFELVLKLRGWSADLTKGDWRIILDTSSWMVLQTASNERTFDVAVPDAYHGGWTANLIEHLARMEDERARLRGALEAIRDDPSAGPSAVSAANAALAECYHSWLVGHQRSEWCPICGAQRERSAVTVATEAIATARECLWAVTRDDVRQSLAGRLERAEADITDHPERAVDELVAFVGELEANPREAIPGPAAEEMTAHAGLAATVLRPRS